MLALSDSQLRTLMTFAADIPPDKRSTFLERVGAMLAVRGRGHFNDDDVAEVAKLALTGLVRQPAVSSPTLLAALHIVK
jgi:hypothetical protein